MEKEDKPEKKVFQKRNPSVSNSSETESDEDFKEILTDFKYDFEHKPYDKDMITETYGK